MRLHRQGFDGLEDVAGNANWGKTVAYHGGGGSRLDLTVTHADDPVATVADGLVVGDDDRGQTGLQIERAQQTDDFISGVGIERAGRFVRPDDGRVVDQRRAR